MIDHLGVSVSDIKNAKEFYLKALAPLGYELVMEFPEWNVAGLGTNKKADLWITGEGAGKAVHIAFLADSRKAVDAFYEAAIAAGGKDNGKPGIRKEYHPNYYAAFVLDADSNNIEAVCHHAE